MNYFFVAISEKLTLRSLVEKINSFIFTTWAIIHFSFFNFLKKLTIRKLQKKLIHFIRPKLYETETTRRDATSEQERQRVISDLGRGGGVQ